LTIKTEERKAISTTEPGRRLVIGVGNEQRGDDAVGLLVASRLKASAAEIFSVIEWRGDGLGIVNAWTDADTVVMIDAALSGADAGTIYRIDAAKSELPREMFHCSTHAFGVAEAVELARALGQLPRQVIVYGIEGERFEAGEALSPAVADAAGEVEALVLKDMGAPLQVGT